LITDQRQERIIRDTAALGPALALCTVTRCAVRSIHNFAVLGIARGACSIGRRISSVENSRAAPAGTNFHCDYIDLLIRKHSARTLSEGRHRGALHAIRDKFISEFLGGAPGGEPQADSSITLSAAEVNTYWNEVTAIPLHVVA
jgi:hypothetical protein